MKLATKISVTLLGALALAVVSSVAALLAARHTKQLMGSLVEESLEDARAVSQLEISLLEQRGFISSYLLDGNKRWLNELKRREPEFGKWMGRVRRMVQTEELKKTAARLEEVFAEYAKNRDLVVALYDGGGAEEANRVYLRRVSPLRERAYRLCEELVAANKRYTEAVVSDGTRQVNRASIFVAVSVATTVCLGSALLWFFFHGVLWPIRRMAEDARVFGVGVGELGGAQSPRDELREVGYYLRALMSDVRQARSDLERSRGLLLSAEKLASVGKLAASVAHEIRNPLSSLKMRLFSVHRAVGSDPLYEDDLRVMSEEVTRLENVIRNFLEFARPPELRLRSEDASVLIDKALELMRHRLVEKDIRLVREDGSEVPRACVDADQIKQVLINLLLNAVEAMGEGGTIRLAASRDTDSGGREMVVVRVGDTGGGIAEKVRNRVFEPFFSTKEEGTGLGLCIAARIMTRHGGLVELESTTDKGSVFAVWIPAAEVESDGQDPRS